MLRLILIILFAVFLPNSKLLLAIGWWTYTPGDYPNDIGYHPEQPTDKFKARFSHRVHVIQRKLECEYCHSSAKRSVSAGFPSLYTCMGCHTFVKTNSDSIKFIKAKYDAKEEIEWVRVHKLPSYVHFSHARHMNAVDQKGKTILRCGNCHGQVEEMTTVSQWAPMQMGWCLQCHTKGPDKVQPQYKPRDLNHPILGPDKKPSKPFYTMKDPLEYLGLERRASNSTKAAGQSIYHKKGYYGPINCASCHY